MESFYRLIIKLFVVFLCLLISYIARAQDAASFDSNYVITWGNDHAHFLNQGRELQLSMDNYSGAGFASKLKYESGFFHMRIKVPKRDCGGVITSFYLHSNDNVHDELDFEFLGNREGKPITLQTNVFTNGNGYREQRLHLWFDPTADFHTYKIMWNTHQIVFYVDETPIRVYKNNTNLGIPYPRQAMNVQGSVYDGSDWATDGGKTKVQWSSAPFNAHYQDFKIGGCRESSSSGSCTSSWYWWNRMRYSRLNGRELRELRRVRREYMNYDYCADKPRFANPPPECAYNSVD